MKELNLPKVNQIQTNIDGIHLKILLGMFIYVI